MVYTLWRVDFGGFFLKTLELCLISPIESDGFQTTYDMYILVDFFQMSVRRDKDWSISSSDEIAL